MQLYVYKIKNVFLQKQVRCIFFSYCTDEGYRGLQTYYPNVDFCFGIIKDMELTRDAYGKFYLLPKTGIQSYLTGVYQHPFVFMASGYQDEICINFTVMGYFRFFRFPGKKYVLGDDVLGEAFGREGQDVFEKVFAETSFEKRGQRIENFLVRWISDPSADGAIVNCLNMIHSKKLFSTSSIALETGYSKKKIYRVFLEYLDISPKQYLSVLRFRNTLQSMIKLKSDLTSLSYESGYFDQSHFIKDFSFYTGSTPKRLQEKLVELEGSIIVNATS